MKKVYLLLLFFIGLGVASFPLAVLASLDSYSFSPIEIPITKIFLALGVISGSVLLVELIFRKINLKKIFEMLGITAVVAVISFVILLLIFSADISLNFPKPMVEETAKVLKSIYDIIPNSFILGIITSAVAVSVRLVVKKRVENL